MIVTHEATAWFLSYGCEFISAYIAKNERPTQIEHPPLDHAKDIALCVTQDEVDGLVTHETVSSEIFLDMDVHPSNPASTATSEKFE
ncbi:hypothetical protein [Dyella caseinilytica]|uniref:Uncharacterized protein n=1 Tax=Dyella caseinilytica TaxID=1849581 RepID=A0ABX7GUM1_9GAMM|nr:hypothetical protein [Dyella caseinilytica]QRN53985.1 hypothetical protein ISN74_00815 [Dyella caseinilytica]GFZ90705.1 hypothetical protein GCM10011408_07320 [Dyella caseinilytica]